MQAGVENMALSHRLSHTTTARRTCCRMAATRRLNTVVFLGSARDVVPPWGGEKRAGDRVLKWVQNTLASRTATYGSETISHDVTVLDPLEVCLRPSLASADTAATSLDCSLKQNFNSCTSSTSWMLLERHCAATNHEDSYYSAQGRAAVPVYHTLQA